MELRYHNCGHPIRVRSAGDPWARPAYFDGSRSWNEGALRRCPSCGGRLHIASLSEAPGVAATLRAWLAVWPAMRRNIEARLTAYERQDPAAYPYHAERDLAEVDVMLRRVATIAAAVEQHGRSIAESQEQDDPTPTRG